MNWKRPRPNHIGRIADYLAGGIELLETQQGAVFPDLRQTSTLGLACDFSGQHAESRVDVFSFVLFDLERHAEFEAPRLAIREYLIKDSRRLAFKNLRDNVSWRALEPFLAAAGQLPGILLTVVAPKVFTPDDLLLSGFRAPEFEDMTRFGPWKLSTTMKAVWVVHIASLLVAGFAAPGQDLVWMIDQDEIIEDEERVTALSASFHDVVSDYLDFDMGRFVLVTAAADSGNRRIEDLLSIADLAAGAWADVFNTVDSAEDADHLHQLLESKSERSRKKAELIVEWCSQNTRRNLKYMTATVWPGDQDSPVLGQFIYPRRSA